MAILNIFWLSCVPTVKKKREDCKLTDFFIMCCHCIIQTLLLRLVDLGECLRNYRWRLDVNPGEEIRLWKSSHFWKSWAPSRWKRLEMFRIATVRSCHSKSFREERQHIPEILFKAPPAGISSDFFMTAVAFKYICLLGVIYKCLCYLCDLSSMKYFQRYIKGRCLLWRELLEAESRWNKRRRVM